jgi:hypothetical protein
VSSPRWVWCETHSFSLTKAPFSRAWSLRFRIFFVHQLWDFPCFSLAKNLHITIGCHSQLLIVDHLLLQRMMGAPIQPDPPDTIPANLWCLIVKLMLSNEQTTPVHRFIRPNGAINHRSLTSFPQRATAIINATLQRTPLPVLGVLSLSN